MSENDKIQEVAIQVPTNVEEHGIDLSLAAELVIAGHLWSTLERPFTTRRKPVSRAILRPPAAQDRDAAGSRSRVTAIQPAALTTGRPNICCGVALSRRRLDLWVVAFQPSQRRRQLADCLNDGAVRHGIGGTRSTASAPISQCFRRKSHGCLFAG
jgi:hypothetical protein